jgi:hypothetical protein
VSGFKGTDAELIALYKAKRREVERYLDSDAVPEPIATLVEGRGK